MSNQLEMRLWPKKDRKGDEFLIGSSPNIPALVDLREATFVVFYPLDENPNKKDANGRPYKPHATLIIRRDSRDSREFRLDARRNPRDRDDREDDRNDDRDGRDDDRG